MKASELQDLLVAALTRRAGGSRRGWRNAIGTVEIYDMATHAHCNWSITPSGSTQQIAAIEGLLDTVRLDHPFVERG